MDDEERSVREKARESTRRDVEQTVTEAQAELSQKGTPLTRLQVIRRMLGNVPLALFYYERINTIATPADHAELHAGAELIVELLREMEHNQEN